jgi:Mg2+ and Co2+ transporter CorA
MPAANEERSDERNIDANLLPRSLFAPQEDPRKELRDMVESILSEKFMIFLSLLTIPLIVLPFVIRFSPPVLYFFRVCGLSIVSLFVLEYSAKLYLASDRWSHFKSPWHLLDLAIIVAPFLQYAIWLAIDIPASLPLLLRLLRIPRVFMVGGRAIVRQMQSCKIVANEVTKEAETIIQVVDSDFQTVKENLTWEGVGSNLSNGNQEWINFSNMTDEGFGKLSKMLRLHESHFRSELIDEIFPHLDYVQKASLVFLQSGEIKYPEHTGQYLTVSRSGIIVVCNGTKIISVSRHDVDLLRSVLNSTHKPLENSAFVVSVLYSILENALHRYRSIISEIEVDIVKIGSTPRSKLPRDFLDRIYQLNREVSRLVSDLVHFKELLGTIVSKKIPLDGFDQGSEEVFDVLQDDATYLNEAASNLVDNIRYIIDLYINYSSFETNKILKILAVITSISVIPTAVGGLLGENLLNVPFPVYLWQVVLMIAISMVMVTYVFIKLGWLKV